MNTDQREPRGKFLDDNVLLQMVENRAKSIHNIRVSSGTYNQQDPTHWEKFSFFLSCQANPFASGEDFYYNPDFVCRVDWKDMTWTVEVEIYELTDECDEEGQRLKPSLIAKFLTTRDKDSIPLNENVRKLFWWCLQEGEWTITDPMACAECGSTHMDWESGFPGESLLVCQECKHINGSSFNEGAII